MYTAWTYISFFDTKIDHQIGKDSFDSANPIEFVPLSLLKRCACDQSEFEIAIQYNSMQCSKVHSFFKYTHHLNFSMLLDMLVPWNKKCVSGVMVNVLVKWMC